MCVVSVSVVDGEQNDARVRRALLRPGDRRSLVRHPACALAVRCAATSTILADRTKDRSAPHFFSQGFSLLFLLVLFFFRFHLSWIIIYPLSLAFRLILNFLHSLRLCLNFVLSKFRIRVCWKFESNWYWNWTFTNLFRWEFIYFYVMKFRAVLRFSFRNFLIWILFQIDFFHFIHIDIQLSYVHILES